VYFSIHDRISPEQVEASCIIQGISANLPDGSLQSNAYLFYFVPSLYRTIITVSDSAATRTCFMRDTATVEGISVPLPTSDPNLGMYIGFVSEERG
jgi:hypothetical protein